MNSKELEYEIVKALDINSKIYWDTDPELDPNKEFKYLKKYVKKLFKEYHGL